jgi:hypothetical protein
MRPCAPAHRACTIAQQHVPYDWPQRFYRTYEQHKPPTDTRPAFLLSGRSRLHRPSGTNPAYVYLNGRELGTTLPADEQGTDY